MNGANGDLFGSLLGAWGGMLRGVAPGVAAGGDDTGERARRAWRLGEQAVAQALQRAGTDTGALATALNAMFADWGRALAQPRPWPAGDGTPFSPGVEVAFGGLADALGLGPPRQLATAMQQLATAQAEQQRAWIALQALVVQRWPEVAQRTLERLVSTPEGSVPPDSVADVLALWAAQADASGHDALHSEAGAQAMADCIRASTAVQAARNEVGEIVCGWLGLPTRREFDEACLEIQKLKRALREAPRAAPARRRTRETR